MRCNLVNRNSYNNSAAEAKVSQGAVKIEPTKASWGLAAEPP